MRESTKQKRAFAHDIDMLERNQQVWLQQQEYLNAYNDPSQQVQRLEAAGINPNLALDSVNAGNGFDVSGGKGSTQSYAASLGASAMRDASRVQAAQSIGQIGVELGNQRVSAYNAETQRAAANSQIALQAAEKGLISKKAAGQQIQNELDTQYGAKQREATINLQNMMAEDAASSSVMKDISAHNDTIRTGQYVKESAQNMRESAARIDKIRSDISVNDKVKAQIDKGMELTQKIIDDYERNNGKVSDAKVKQLEKLADYLENKTENEDITESNRILIQECGQTFRSLVHDVKDAAVETAKGKRGFNPGQYGRRSRQVQTRTPNGGTQTDNWEYYVPREEWNNY